MRLRHIAVGCALTGGLGFLALPAGSALAANARAADNARAAGGMPHPAPAVVKPRISVSAPLTNNPYDAAVTLTVTLKGESADRQVALYATPAGGTRTLVAAGAVDTKGKWYAQYTLSRATTFTAVFAGDAHYAPASASQTLYAYARVTSRLTGGYATSKASTGVVSDFHGTSTLTLHATVAPNKQGECLEPESEQYEKGVGWDADTKYGCDKLDSLSHDAAPFTLSLAMGDEYRIRADYLHGSDTANLDTQGPWLYFTVTS